MASLLIFRLISGEMDEQYDIQNKPDLSILKKLKVSKEGQSFIEMGLNSENTKSETWLEILNHIWLKKATLPNHVI